VVTVLLALVVLQTAPASGARSRPVKNLVARTATQSRSPLVDNWTRLRQAMTGAVALSAVALDHSAIAPGHRVYTYDADFDEGVMVGVNHDFPAHDQLQLNETPSTFPFIWIAASGRDTIIKIDTIEGKILGEYRSCPKGRGGNPSRTTVDLDGNVWVGNRNEATNGGSIVRVGLLEAGACVDRNGNGRIDTSTGLGDVRPWGNGGGADDNGGVSTAEDECIINYVRVPPTGVRTIAVDAHNDVWAGGPGDHIHVKVDSRTGQVVDRVDATCGGYGGLIDGNGVLWSASTLMYLDTRARTLEPRCLNSRGRYSYGLGIDMEGYVWNSTFGGDTVIRWSPSGLWTGEFPTGGASGDRGVAITPADNNVWVANSAGSDVSRLDRNGSLRSVVPVGNSPTGVAVDQAGKVWVTNMGSNSASRIDPALNKVDLTVDLGPNASPYNYSDMTGMVVRSFTTRRGTWLVVHNSGEAGTAWGAVTWTSLEPTGTAVTVRARAADAVSDLGNTAWQAVGNGTRLASVSGRYLQVEATLTTQTNGITPILYDLTVWPGFVPTPEASPSPTNTPTPTPTPTGTPTPTPSPTPGPTPGPVYLPLLLREDCPKVVEHADVALILDASTSMLDATVTGQSKLDAARNAIRDFLGIIAMPGDRAALVSYNDRAYLLQPMTGDPSAVSRALDRATVALHTRTDLALHMAADELGRSRGERPENKSVIILLTDGLPNPVGPDEVLRVADAVKASGITIYTIGLGKDVNADLLRAVASWPNAYYPSPGGDDLAELYRRIARVIYCPGTVFWPSN
jgi:streptogramin lyase